MTHRSDQNQKSELPLEPPQGETSDADLALFLRRLAALYGLSKTGNASLSRALSDLASWVAKRGAREAQAGRKLPKKEILREPPLDLAQLKTLDTKAVEKFVANEQKTKLELIDLASARFSIPRSQLMRLRTSAVRETIRAALLHEDSIEIISREARRDGSKRSS